MSISMEYYEHEFDYCIDFHIVRFTVQIGYAKGTIDLKVSADPHFGTHAMYVSTALLEKMFYFYCATGVWSPVSIPCYTYYLGERLIKCESGLGGNIAEAEYLSDTCHFEYDNKIVYGKLLDENCEPSSQFSIDISDDYHEVWEHFLDYIVGIEIIGYEEREWNDEEDD